MTIGKSIRHHRKRLGLTQLELAERVGVSVQAISKWETSTGLPDIAMAAPLARAMGTTTDELLQFGQRRKEQERLWMETMQSSGDDPEKMTWLKKQLDKHRVQAEDIFLMTVSDAGVTDVILKDGEKK